jgi:HSP20 family molecular chaperone IbpA
MAILKGRRTAIRRLVIMNSNAVKSAFAISAAAIIGFAGGFATKNLLEKETPAQPSIAYNTSDRLSDVWPAMTLSPFRWNDYDPLLVPFHLASTLLPQASLMNPALEVKQDGKQVQVLVSNMRPEDVHVKMQGNKLVVEGHHKQQSNGDYREETFMQTVDLPQGVNPAAIDKKIGGGKLVITIGHNSRNQNASAI